MLIDRIDLVGGTLHLHLRLLSVEDMKECTSQYLRKKVANTCALLFPVLMELEEMEKLDVGELQYFVDIVNKSRIMSDASVVVPPQLAVWDCFPFSCCS